MILSVDQITTQLNDLVLDGLNQYTSFVCEERFTKCEVLTNLMATVTMGVKERMPTMCDQLRDAINLHVVSAMLKICREKFDRFPHTKELTNVEVISVLSEIQKDVKNEVGLQLTPYVALLGLCNFPERF